MSELAIYGEQIHAFVTDSAGAIICPLCDLEMARAPLHALFYCGSGNFGDGHWISADDVLIPS